MRLIFFGTSRFAVPALQALLSRPESFTIVAVITRPDQPVGRKQVLTSCPVAAAAREAGLVTLTPTRLKDEALIERLRELQPDAFVVAAYGKIIPADMLAIPPCGSFNLHGSLLPAYRGASPMQAALADGLTETGVTMMGVDAEMDHGPIYSAVRVPIDQTDDFLTLEAKMATAGAALLIRDLPQALSGDLHPVEQNHGAATYTRIIAKEDGLIDWAAQDALNVVNRSRAYAAWPGCFTYWQRRGQCLRLAVKRASLTRRPDGLAAGTVFRDADGTPAVVAARDAVRLDSLQLEGKPMMTGRQFLNGYADFIGSLLCSSNQNS